MRSGWNISILVLTIFISCSTVQSASSTGKQSSSVVMDYMVGLKEKLTDSNGKPKISNTSDPTEAWALQDIGKQAK